MLATITRMLDTFRETRVAMYKILIDHGLSDGAAFRSSAQHVNVSVPGWLLARAITHLDDVHRSTQQSAEREEKLERRVSDLSSSNGALMVDRDRGIREAHARMAGARRVAADAVAALREHGIEPGAELDTLAADAIRHYDATLYRLDAEVQRLNDFRIKMVGLIQQCQDQAAAGKGLTVDQVAKLGRHIDRANNKACGR